MSNTNGTVEIFTPDCTEKIIDALCQVEKLAWSSPGENIEADREKIVSRLKGFNQGVSLSLVNSKPAGSQYSFTFNWEGELNYLTTWDQATCNGWTDKVHIGGGNTGFLVGVGVVPEFRGLKFNCDLAPEGHRISELLIAYTLDKLFGLGVKQVVACARVPLYHTKPELSIEEYCTLRRADGKLYDPVLRFHERLHAELIKPAAYAMDDAESLNAGCFVCYKPMAKRL